MKYETVIGLECHAQLQTKSKVFCGCSTAFGCQPNENICPVCLGLPGALPVLNKKVVEFTIKMALATNCVVKGRNIFARKNYFYPDLPKGYQISQYELPIAVNGYVDIEVDGGTKRIGLTRIHMEEDAGKSIHSEEGPYSLVDLNRACVPLIEIVSEPDLRTPGQASAYMRKIRSILQYLEICDGNMEEGNLRCDANVSVRPVGQAKFGTKAELKNLNSFKFLEKGIEFEIARQIEILEEGGKIVQETRLYDNSTGKTFSMRSKEEANDYRYFPDPDLVPLVIDEAWVEKVRAELPELGDAKARRFIESYGLPEYDAKVLTTSKSLATYFEACVSEYPNAKIVSNWIMSELLRELKEDDREIEQCPIAPANLGALLKMIDSETISGKIAKGVFEDMYKTGQAPGVIVEEKGLIQITDEKHIEDVIDDILSKSEKQIEQYRQGKTNLFGFFVGQVMKATQGKANPKLVNEILKRKLEK